MRYKDIMQPITKNDFIAAQDPIEKALERIQKSSNGVLIVQNSVKDVVDGIITYEKLLDAYNLGISIEDKVRRLIQLDFEIVCEQKPVNLNTLQGYSICLVENELGEICGIITEKNSAKLILDHVIKKADVFLKKYRYMGRDKHDWNVDPSAGQKKEGLEVIDLDKIIQSVLENNERLWNIIRYSPDSIYIADSKGNTLYVNKAFERASNVKVENVIGASVMELEEKEFFNPAVTPMVLREKKPCTIKQKVSRGSKCWIVTGVPIFDELGDIDMVVTNAKDIEEFSILQNYIEKGKNYIVETTSDTSKERNIICEGKHMQAIMNLAANVAQLDTTVLITGESGVGKGIISKYIHSQSNRNKEKLIEINCSAIPESLFESELFGYESGAFTGAKKGGKPGLIEMAHKGTLVLDEIGDMPLMLQSKLLKVLQDKKLMRVGGINEKDIDVRIIASTNKSLESLMEKGLFRADLYYRLNVFPVHILPLRERREEIPALIDYYLDYYNKKHKKNARFTENILKKISEHPWYGNVRELKYFIERMVIMHDQMIDKVDLRGVQIPGNEEEPISVKRIIPLQMALAETERQLFLLAAKKGKSSYEVASLLHTSQSNAYRKMKKYIQK